MRTCIHTYEPATLKVALNCNVSSAQVVSDVFSLTTTWLELYESNGIFIVCVRLMFVDDVVAQMEAPLQPGNQWNYFESFNAGNAPVVMNANMHTHL